MKTTIRLLFLIITPLLFLQVLVKKQFSEPYPAVMLPGFRGVLKNKPCLTMNLFELTVFFSDNDSISIDQKHLFDPIPPWHTPYVLNTIRSKKTLGEHSNEYVLFQKYLKKRLYDITQKKEIHYLKIVEVENSYCEQAKNTVKKHILTTKIIYLDDKY